MKLTISVTQEDIDNGVPGDSCNCPVAIAADLAFDKANLSGLIVVDKNTITREYGQEEVTFSLPTIAQDFIFAFDRVLDVHPFTFEIDTDCALNLGPLA